jgi:hypothetical protein
MPSSPCELQNLPRCSTISYNNMDPNIPELAAPTVTPNSTDSPSDVSSDNIEVSITCGNSINFKFDKTLGRPS